MVRQKVYLLPENLDQLNKIVKFNSFTLSSVDKVTTGTKSFMSVILNSVFSTTEKVTHFSDQVKLEIISQLINGILRVLEKLLKYFNRTAISKIFLLSASGAFPAILNLNLNDSDSAILAFCSSL